MMAPSASQNDLDALSKKIDAALAIPNKRVTVDGATKKSTSEFISCQEFLEYLEETRKAFVEERNKNPEKFQYAHKYISSDFISHDCVWKSKLLEDQKLFDAILFAKIFQYAEDYARHRDEYRGEMVWLEMKLPNANAVHVNDIALISENKIIYEYAREDIDNFRKDFKEHWALFAEEVRKNLIETFGAPVSIPDLGEYVSDLRSSFDAAAVSSNFNEHQNVATVTAEMKKILLDELSSLNLHPRLKQQFEFDLKLSSSKDVYYWLYRLEGLRCFANSAPVGSAQSPELEQLRRKVAEQEKTIASLREEVQSAVNLSEMVSKSEEVDSWSESGQSIATDTSRTIPTYDPHLIAQAEKLVERHIHPHVLSEGIRRSTRAQEDADMLVRKFEEEFSPLQLYQMVKKGLFEMLYRKLMKMDTSASDTLDE